MRGRRTSREKERKNSCKVSVAESDIGWIVAFRSAKVARIPRYFRGAKGDEGLSATETTKDTQVADPVGLLPVAKQVDWVCCDVCVTTSPAPPGWNAVWPLAELAGVPLPGDANREGLASFSLNGRRFGPQGADLAIFAENRPAGAVGYQIGGTPDSDLWAAYQTPLSGDANGDGTVDINDLTIVLAHYGQSIGASAAATAAVPEPSCLALLGIATAGLLACARRRRN